MIALSDRIDKLCIAMLVIAFLMFASTGYIQHRRSGDGFLEAVVVRSEDGSEETSEPAATVSSTKRSTDDPTATVPTEEQTVTPAEPLYININTASSADLQRLYGIGPKLADAIISYRELHGMFSNIEELQKVNGIGGGIFDAVKEYIYVDDPRYPEETTAPAYEPPAQVPEPERRLEDCIPINIDTADAETLMLLPYVDEDIAQKIIELRGQLKGFSHVYELLIIDDLSDKQVAEIIEYVCIDKEEHE